MDPLVKQQLHLYCTIPEWDEIKSAMEKEQNTPAGRIRSGDLLRTILLEWARKQKK